MNVFRCVAFLKVFLLFISTVIGQRYYPCGYESSVVCNSQGDSIKTNFDKLFSNYEDTTILFSFKNNKIGLINSKDLSEIVPTVDDQIYLCKNLGKIALRINGSNYQLYDYENKKNIGESFESNINIFNYIDGPYCFIKPEDLITCKRHSKFGLLSSEGKVITNFKYDTLFTSKEDRTFYAASSINELDIYSIKGEFRKKIKVENVIGFWDSNNLLVSLKKNENVFVDEFGNINKRPKNSNNRYSVIANNKSENLYSHEGKKINTSDARYIENADNSGLFIIYDESISVIDSTGKILFNNLYSAKINWSEKGYKIITGRYTEDSVKVFRLYNFDGSDLLMGDFTNIEFSHPVYKLFIDKKIGICVPDLNIEIKPKYEEIYFNGDEKPLSVKMNGKWALMDFKENSITEFKYNSMSRMFGNDCEVDLNGEKFRIDKDGNRIK